MCLTISKHLTEKLLEGSAEEIKAWKVLRIDGCAPYRPFQYAPGLNKTEDELQKNESVVEGGALHVYLDRVSALDLADWRHSSNILQYVVVQVFFKKADLIAAGFNSWGRAAAVKALWITPEDWEAAGL